MDDHQLRAVLEALLLATTEPLVPAKAAEVVGVSAERCQRLLEELAEEYRQRESGWELQRVAGGYRLVTRPQFAPYIERLYRRTPAAPLSEAALETLAVIAYRQPVTRAEIEHIRGVNCDSVLNTLLERGLIEEVGRKEAPGRPILYGTSRHFLEHFGLDSPEDLPPLPDEETEGPPGERATK